MEEEVILFANEWSQIPIKRGHLRKGEHIQNPVRRDPLPNLKKTWESVSLRCKKD
jgi:hypothetical protein